MFTFRLSLRILVVGCAAAWLAAASASCTTNIPSDEHYFDNFKTAVADADQQGYTPYWLGREFVAGGLTFRGPDVPDFGGEIEGGGVIMSYDARLARGGVSLNMSLFSGKGWSGALQMGLGRTAPGARTRQVTVAGRIGRLTIHVNKIDGLDLEIDLGGTHLLASVRAGISGTPGGPDLNPLNDEATFLSVMQHLRPYPQ